jgi:hypothetical protein
VTGQAVLGPDLELLAGPADERERVQVREHHALRAPRGPGRVQDVREVQVDHLDARRRDLPAVDVPSGEHLRADAGRARAEVGRVQHNDLLDRGPMLEHLGPQVGLLGAAQQHPDPAVPRDERQPLRRGPRIERHVGRAGLHRAVDADHGLERLVEVQANPIALVDPEALQQVRELVRPPIELGVRDRAIAVLDRRSVRVLPGRPRQQLVQQVLHRHSYNPSCAATMLRWISEVPE